MVKFIQLFDLLCHILHSPFSNSVTFATLSAFLRSDSDFTIFAGLSFLVSDFLSLSFESWADNPLGGLGSGGDNSD